MKKQVSIVTLSLLLGATLPVMASTGENNPAVESIQQATRTVTGVVLDATGEPVIGANVVVKSNTTLGSITDIDGNFSINKVPSGATLVVSYIGYLDQEVKLSAGKNSYKITLQEDTKALEEVVVVGYGVQKKVNMTGAVANVQSEKLTAIPSTNLSNSLAGRAAGATIVGNSGLMGASSEIRLRGSFNDPLFVIDGVTRDKDAFDALEPHEIDQISFLKDAATASVYGSNASNGVVLVKTKTGGKNQKTMFNYQGSYTFATPTQTLFTDLWDAVDELEYQNAVARFKGLAEPNTAEEIAYFRDNNINYNVNDYIWQTPWNTKHSLSVQGGTDKVQYYILGSFLAEEGSYKSLENHQYSLRSNVSVDLSKYIKLGVNIAAKESNDKRFYWPFSGDDDQAVYDLYRCTFNTPRAVPFYVYADGTPANEVTDYPVYPDFGSWQGWNVVDQVIGDRYIRTKRRDIQAIGTLEVDLGFLLKGLSTKVVGAYNFNTYHRKKYMTYQTSYKLIKAQPGVNDYIYAPVDPNQISTFTFSQRDENLVYGTNQVWESQFNWFLNYDQKFGKHAVSAMAVFEVGKEGNDWVQASAYSPIANIDQFFVYSSDEENRSGYAYEGNGGRMSWIGRLNYNYDDRYIAEFSFRYDGNDKFAKGNRWGFFPAVSAAWRISQENFMESTKGWLSNLKLRASWGQTGSDKNVSNVTISDFSYTQTYSVGSSYMFGDGLASTITANAVPNPNVTWATSTNYNVGLDLGFFDNRLNATIDVFYRKEKDVLGSRTVSLPSTYGQSLAAENYAERSWRGGEVSLMWNDRVANGQIDYSVYANLGYADDQWDVLDQSAYYREGGALEDLSLIGKSPYRILGYVADHLLTDPEEVEALKAQGFKQFGRDPYLGGILFKDTRSDGYKLGPDGKIDSNDYYNILSENAKPRWNYGFGGSFKWKGISVDAHFQGVMSYDRVAGTGSGGFNQYGGANRVYYPIWASDKCYDPEYNPNGVYPRVIGSSWYESGTGVTSYWLRNGAYIRLKNLNIAYDLPKEWLRPLGISAVQVFGNATNLFVISDMTEFQDPEQEHYDSYPLMKTFSFGLNLTF